MRLKGEDDFYKGYFLGTGDSSISVDGNIFYLNEIESIRIYRPFFKTIGVAQRIAGGGVIGLNGVNNALSNTRPLITDTQWVWAGVLIATSFVWDYFSRRTYNVEEKWDMEIIDFANVGE